MTCHAVNGRGGTLGPELDARRARRPRATGSTRWIRDPHRLQPKTLMPRFRFTDDEVRDVAAYLASEFSEPPEGFDGERRAARTRRSPTRAARVFEKRGCYSCHELEGFPKLARIGPKLAAIGDRVLEPAPLVARGIRPTLPNWLFTKVRAPDAVLEGARMPTFGFSRGRGRGARGGAPRACARGRCRPRARRAIPCAPAYEPQGEFGALVRRYRCLSCHSIRAPGGTLSTVALDRIGSQLTRDHIERFVAEAVRRPRRPARSACRTSTSRRRRRARSPTTSRR